jgi:hypothetical protein
VGWRERKFRRVIATSHFGRFQQQSLIKHVHNERFKKVPVNARLATRKGSFVLKTCMSGKPLKPKAGRAAQGDHQGFHLAGGAAARGETSFGGSAAGAGDDVPYDDSRLLPIANTSRIMKTALPPNAKISREGKFDGD